MKRLIGTIRRRYVGSRFLILDGRVRSLLDSIGYVQPCDVGKQVYDVDGVIQVENGEQRDRRLKGGTA